MAYRPPYGSQPPGAFSASPQPVRPGGAGGVQNPRQQQFGMGMPQGQGFQMMSQPPAAVPAGGMVPQMYPGQPGGIYPGTGYGQTPVQPVYMGQPGMVHPGMVQPGLVGRGVDASGMVPGMGPRLPQNMTAEQQKKFAEQQKKLAEEQKKKEEQERKERYREEQKRKLKEFSTGGRASLGSKSLDMGELLSKGLMTSPSNQGPHPATAPGLPYQYGMQASAQAGFVPHSQPVGMAPMMPGGVMVARQPLQPAASATHPLTHSQSLDDGFSGFQKAAPPSTSLTPISSDQTEGDDFGDFLQAPSKPAAPTTPSQQPPMQLGVTTPTAAQSQTPPKKNDDDDFGDFLGGPSPSPPGKASEQQETTGNQSPATESSGTPQEESNSIPNAKKPGGKSLESMLMQSTDLSEAQKERKRFNQKPSLNEVKGHGGSSPRSASTFIPSAKARQWKESEDLSSLFTLPGAEPSQQAPAVPGVGVGAAVAGVGQLGPTGLVNPPVAALPAQQPPGAVHFPAWLQNESALPTVYRQVLEASVREGSIDTSLLYPIFLLSGLDRTLLGHIWSMVNLTMPGQLIPQELFMALALIAQAQKGHEISLPALCTLSEAPVPNLSPQNPAQQPALQQLSSSAAPQPPVASQPQTTSGEDDDFAPFQGAPSVPSVAAEAEMPPAPSILSAMTSSAETSVAVGKKPASSGTLSSLVIPAVSSSSASRHSASPASFTQEENCYIFANSPAPSSGRSSPFIWDQNTIYDKLTTRSYDSASSSSLSDHTPTEGDDEDESFDDFKSAPSDSMHRDLDLIPQPIPTLPGPGQKASSSSVSAGAAHIPALVPPREKTAGIFAAIPPPPQGTKGGSVAVRAFGSEEQLRADSDFGDFGDFKAAGSDSKTSLSSAATPGSILGSQPFKHSASESNLQGMQSKTANDRYAALRDLGDSLFDTEPVALPPPAVGGTDDDEFADFQQAGGTLPGIPVASAGEAASFTSPANQTALFESFSARDRPQQSSQGFAAFSPPRESSDWAEAAKKDKDQKASSPHEEEFEGFFSSRSKDGGSGRDTRNNAEESDTFDKYSSLAGLHAFVTDKPDPVIPSQDSSFGDFQTGATKVPLQKPSTILPGVGVVAQPTTSSTDFFRLTPPPMTSPSPSSEEAPEDDRFNALRDLSVVDPFEQVGSATQQGSMDGTGSDFYQTHFETIDPTPKGVSKQGLSLGDGMNADSLQSKPHKLELTLDTPVSTANKAFPIGSINELDLKNFDLKLTVDSKSKEGADEPRERGDSFGDFTAASSTEPPPLSKAPSVTPGGNTMALLPSSGHPPPAAVKPDTTLFGDRYSEVAGDSSDEGRHASEWEKCLSKCYEVMSKANSIFNNISSSSVCSEVIGSAAGIDYLTGVIEVYRVACRITTSIQGLGIDNDILGKLEKDINQIWNNLSAFLQLSSIKPNEGSFVFKTAMLRPEPSNTPQACGVCLLNVDSRSKAFDRSEDSHKLSYGGRQYHATCANLWVNMVDSILPALPLNTLL